MEVTQRTIAPAASSILADRGAAVIKAEHPVPATRRTGIDISTAQGQQLIHRVGEDLRHLPIPKLYYSNWDLNGAGSNA
jgi:hypothetical protein